MKKLKLKAIKLAAKEVLTRDQLKNIIGGDGSGDCGSNCFGTCYISCNGNWGWGTCAWSHPELPPALRSCYCTIAC